MEDVPKQFGTHIMMSSLNLDTRREDFFSSFDPDTEQTLVADALKATSAIPAIFKSVPIVRNGVTQWYVDGGAGANDPFIALDRYNQAFPGAPVNKVLIVYCYPDDTVDIGVSSVGPNKTNTTFKSYKDALLGTVPAMQNAQEQIAEMFVIDKVAHENWDVMAMWPAGAPCDSLDFTKTGILQDGYNYGVVGNGYSYKDKSPIFILDFLKRS
jgi:predicted acylesterase/phospholipase RssA